MEEKTEYELLLALENDSFEVKNELAKSVNEVSKVYDDDIDEVDVLIKFENNDGKTEKVSSLSVNTDSVSNSGVDNVPPSFDLLSTLPSMRGKLEVQNGLHICRGEWAMSDAAHEIPDQTSKFEFHIKVAHGTPLPVSGKYSGWFNIKQPPPKNYLRIEDKELYLNYVQTGAPEEYSISGQGINKFGRYTVSGTLKGANIQLYRIYNSSKKVAPTPKSIPGASPRQKEMQTPRGSSGRVRKPSFANIEVSEVVVSKKAKTVAPPPPQIVREAASVRQPRLSNVIIKCAELLKELSRHLQATYFLEPVDYIKLNIPDYPSVISEPMDFQTIRQNLDKNCYLSHEEFAEHMRLVFKNAITYNQRRDNPVHIAAREMSNKFEEKYRILLSQMGGAFMGDIETAPATTTKKKGRVPVKGAKGKLTGPREAALPIAHPIGHHAHTPAVEGNVQHLLDMQKKFEELQNEVMQLRTVVRQNEIRNSLESQRMAAHEPLTLEEKRVLITQISQLDASKMAYVVEVIQSALPTSVSSEGDEVEIPLDELDTFTLRKLQDYVFQNTSQPNVIKKKRSVPASPTVNKNAKEKKMKSEAFVPHVPLVHENHSATELPAIETVQRERSISIDFFETDDANQTLHSHSVNNLQAWKVGLSGESKEKSEELITWDESIINEKKDNSQREIELKLEEEKLVQQRTQLEQDRIKLHKAIYEQQKLAQQQVLECEEKQKHEQIVELQRQRESERLAREAMSKTVELDAHKGIDL